MDQREVVGLTSVVSDDAPPAQLLAEVFDGGYHRLVAQLHDVTGDLGEAQDLVQEAFVRAASDLPRFAQAPDPDAWLCAVALDLHHRRRRPPRVWRRRSHPAGDDPPDLASIELRGRVRRHRRTAVTVSLAAASVVLGIGVAGLLAEHRPVRTVGVPTTLDFWPGNQHRPLVRAGTYDWPLSPYPDVPSVRVTLGPGWRADVGLDHTAGSGSVELVVSDVDQVVRTPCEVTDRGMVDVSDEPAALAAAISGAPGLQVQAPARHVTAFGRPAQHLRLLTTDAASCPYGEPYLLVDTAEGLVSAPPPGTPVDVWVVDVHGRGVVVLTATTPDADGAGRVLLQEVLDGMELVPSGDA